MTPIDETSPRKSARPFWIAAGISWSLLLLTPVIARFLPGSEEDKAVLFFMPVLVSSIAGAICAGIATMRLLSRRPFLVRLLLGALASVLSLAAIAYAAGLVEETVS